MLNENTPLDEGMTNKVNVSFRSSSKGKLLFIYTSILLSIILGKWILRMYLEQTASLRDWQIITTLDGLILTGVMLTVLIIAEKRVLKSNPQQSIKQLTVFGSSVCFISEAIFQLLRQFTFHDYSIQERIYYFMLGTLGITCFGAVYSFFIAFQLKTKKTQQLILYIIGFMIIINIIKYSFPSLFQK